MTLSFFAHSTVSLLYFVISNNGRGVGNGPSISQPLLMPLMRLLKDSEDSGCKFTCGHRGHLGPAGTMNYNIVHSSFNGS